jgi:mRNA-degrading endonuclease toxin of MazEF toxin-antitoxin module
VRLQITSTVREIPEEVRLGKEEGLSRPSVVNLDNVHVVPKAGYALDWAELKVL